MSGKEDIKNADKIVMHEQFAEKGLYVREDDQDWGSAGMNNVQKDSSISQ